MLPGSGGAGHLCENRRTIVRSGDHVSNHNHENPRHQSTTPKAALLHACKVSLRVHQIIELMIAAAKGARIHTFVCGQLTDPGTPTGEAASRLQIVGPKHAGQSHVG